VNPASSCTPTTCAAQGKNCGTISNGCGGTLTCGSCTAPQTCGGGGVANLCGGGCTPTTCAAQGKNCGTIADGCGGTLTCGACTAPQTCGAAVATVCGTAPTCDDGNLCTTDVSSPAPVGCEHLANALTCDDGKATTTGDICSGTACMGLIRNAKLALNAGENPSLSAAFPAAGDARTDGTSTRVSF